MAELLGPCWVLEALVLLWEEQQCQNCFLGNSRREEGSDPGNDCMARRERGSSGRGRGRSLMARVDDFVEDRAGVGLDLVAGRIR